MSHTRLVPDGAGMVAVTQDLMDGLVQAEVLLISEQLLLVSVLLIGPTDSHQGFSLQLAAVAVVLIQMEVTAAVNMVEVLMAVCAEERRTKRLAPLDLDVEAIMFHQMAAVEAVAGMAARKATMTTAAQVEAVIAEVLPIILSKTETLMLEIHGFLTHRLREIC